MELTDLPNIGPMLAGNVKKIGVESPEALRSLGLRRPGSGSVFRWTAAPASISFRLWPARRRVFPKGSAAGAKSRAGSFFQFP